jgi:hypothetical protein
MRSARNVVALTIVAFLLLAMYSMFSARPAEAQGRIKQEMRIAPGFIFQVPAAQPYQGQTPRRAVYDDPDLERELYKSWRKGVIDSAKTADKIPEAQAERELAVVKTETRLIKNVGKNPCRGWFPPVECYQDRGYGGYFSGGGYPVVYSRMTYSVPSYGGGYSSRGQ